MALQFRQWGEDGGRISAVKTATATLNLAKVEECLAIELARRQDLPWATVCRDADGADQTALTLPVGRVILV